MPAYQGDDETRRVGALIRQARDARRWQQDGLARRLTAAGLPATQPIVARIEAGKRAMRPNDLRVIAETLGLPVAMLSPDVDPLADDGTEYDEEWLDFADHAELDDYRERLQRAARAYQMALNDHAERWSCKHETPETIARRGAREASNGKR